MQYVNKMPTCFSGNWKIIFSIKPQLSINSTKLVLRGFNIYMKIVLINISLLAWDIDNLDLGASTRWEEV